MSRREDAGPAPGRRRPSSLSPARPLLVLAVAAATAAAPLPAVAWPEDLDEITVSQSGGLSESTLAGLAEVAPLVGAEMAVVHTATLRLVAVRRDGRDVQAAPPGFAYPMAVAAVDPETAAPLLGSRVARALRAGNVVMSEMSAALRGAEAGDVVTLQGWDGSVTEVTIGALAPDEELEWSELLLPLAVADAVGLDRPSRVVLWDYDDLGVASLLLRYVLPDRPLRVRTPTTRLEGRDFVLPLVLVKQRFGEFAFRPLDGDRIEVEQAWEAANIVEVDVPPLGRFRCHRAVVPYIRAAIAEVERLRLSWLLDSDDFQAAGGCFNPRMTRGGDEEQSVSLSRHSWGIAVDLNPSTNPFGGPVRLEPRIGEAFRRWGFAWGAGWARPDGMHLEWSHVPPELVPQCSSHVLVRSDRTGVGWEVYARTDRCAVS